MPTIIPRAERINYGGVYKLSVRNAYRRSIPFALSRKHFDALVVNAQGRCMVSGIPFSNERIPGSARRPYFPSLDRIDSSKGYSCNNVRLVCVLVNIALNEWGLDPLMRVAQAIVGRSAESAGQLEVYEPLQEYKEEDYSTVADYFKERYGEVPLYQTVRVTHAAKRYCESHDIEVSIVKVKTKLLKDGTWGTRLRNAYPIPILRDVCDDLIATENHIRRPID